MPTDLTGKEEALTGKKRRKNQINFDLETLSHRHYSVNLFAIEGVSFNTVMTLLAEVGSDIHKFGTSKQFVSWLRLAPKNKISGGRLISSKTPKGKNRLALALRNAANSVDRIKHGHLYAFFKRVAYKKGRGAAVTATARKIAVIIWNMCVKKEPYKPIDESLYTEKIRNQVIKNMVAKMKRVNLTISDLVQYNEFS